MAAGRITKKRGGKGTSPTKEAKGKGKAPAGDDEGTDEELPSGCNDGFEDHEKDGGNGGDGSLAPGPSTPTKAPKTKVTASEKKFNKGRAETPGSQEDDDDTPVSKKAKQLPKIIAKHKKKDAKGDAGDVSR